eukprot:scaffold2672_cov112-Isochrysis_galbana.AAC.4
MESSTPVRRCKGLAAERQRSNAASRYGQRTSAAGTPSGTAPSVVPSAMCSGHAAPSAFAQAWLWGEAVWIFGNQQMNRSRERPSPLPAIGHLILVRTLPCAPVKTPFHQSTTVSRYRNCITHPFDPQACQSQSVARGAGRPIGHFLAYRNIGIGHLES